MISCKRGYIEIEGEDREIMADWATITVAMYKNLVRAGMKKEDVNAMLVSTLMMSVNVASELLKEEEGEK